jgi:hypothetical protein
VLQVAQLNRPACLAEMAPWAYFPVARMLAALIVEHRERICDTAAGIVRQRGAPPELFPETFTLGELGNEIEGPAVGEAEARGLRLVMRIDSPQSELRADRQLIISALSNLAHNALKFTRPGGTVTVYARAEDNRVRLEVATGAVACRRAWRSGSFSRLCKGRAIAEKASASV